MSCDPNAKKDTRPKRSGGAFVATADFGVSAGNENTHYKKPRGCAICKKKDHRRPECRVLPRESVETRWTIARKHNWCYNCLIPGPTRPKCNKAPGCSDCTSRHHSLRHGGVSSSNKSVQKNASTSDNAIVSKPVNTAAVYNHLSWLIEHPKVLLTILTLRARAQKYDKNFALIDEGSTITLIDKKLARNLGLRGTRMDLSLTSLQDEKLMTNCDKVGFNVTGTFGKHQIKYAVAAPNLKLPFQSISEDLLIPSGENPEKLKIRP